ncbi:hypothetical protein CR513_04498, partial [Mucuna pruriens]
MESGCASYHPKFDDATHASKWRFIHNHRKYSNKCKQEWRLKKQEQMLEFMDRDKKYRMEILEEMVHHPLSIGNIVMVSVKAQRMKIAALLKFKVSHQM